MVMLWLDIFVKSTYSLSHLAYVQLEMLLAKKPDVARENPKEKLP